MKQIPNYFYCKNNPKIIFKKLWEFQLNNEKRILCYTNIKWDVITESCDHYFCPYKKVCANRSSHLVCFLPNRHKICKSNAIDFYLKKE